MRTGFGCSVADLVVVVSSGYCAAFAYFFCEGLLLVAIQCTND